MGEMYTCLSSLEAKINVVTGFMREVTEMPEFTPLLKMLRVTMDEHQKPGRERSFRKEDGCSDIHQKLP